MRLKLHTPPLPPGVRRGEESWVCERSSWRHKHTDCTFLWVKLHLSVTSVAPPRERPFLQRSRLQKTFSFKSIHNRLSNLSWVQLISNFSSRGPSGGMSLNVLPVVSAAGYSWWHTRHRQLWVHLGGRRGLRSGTSSELRPRPEQVRLQHPFSAGHRSVGSCLSLHVCNQYWFGLLHMWNYCKKKCNQNECAWAERLGAGVFLKFWMNLFHWSQSHRYPTSLSSTSASTLAPKRPSKFFSLYTLFLSSDPDLLVSAGQVKIKKMNVTRKKPHVNNKSVLSAPACALTASAWTTSRFFLIAVKRRNNVCFLYAVISKAVLLNLIF